MSARVSRGKPGHGPGDTLATQARLGPEPEERKMNTPISMVGTIGTVPERRQTGTGASVCRFRLACSERRFDRETNAWVDGEASWLTIIAYRGLADHAHASFNKGDRIFVSGRLKVRPWQNDDGKSGVAVEVDADALGHDLRWGTSKFTRVPGAQAAGDTGAGSDENAPAESDDTGRSAENVLPGDSDSSQVSDVRELVGAGASSVQAPY